jgi:hypothetical protein
MDAEMTPFRACRRAIVILLVVCLPLISARSQAPVSIELKSATVITDSKGSSKAINLEFVVTTPQVVDHVKLSFRKLGAAVYSELDLRPSPELLYEASIPYAKRIEYYLTVLPERGTPSTVGSGLSPRLLECEDLPRVKEAGHHTVKFRVLVGVSVAVTVIAGIFGFRVATSHHKQP